MALPKEDKTKSLDEAAELAALREELARLKSTGVPGYTPEQSAFLREKMQLGLTQEHAATLLDHQEKWEKHPDHPNNKVPTVLVTTESPAATDAVLAGRVANLEKAVSAIGENLALLLARSEVMSPEAKAPAGKGSRRGAESTRTSPAVEAGDRAGIAQGEPAED